MNSDRALAHRVDATLRPDPARVVARLFLPGEEQPVGQSRAGAVATRVLELPETDVAETTTRLLAEFAPRHRDLAGTWQTHAAMLSSYLSAGEELSPARSALLGAAFTAEYAVEGAALCNPSPILHPDQSALLPGQVRVAVSVRGIGEGHISSLGFAVAVIGPGPAWVFEPRALPAVAALSRPACLPRSLLRALLTDIDGVDRLANSILSRLPEQVLASDLEALVSRASHDLLGQPAGVDTVDLLRRLVASTYETSFPADATLSQQVLLPTAAEERNGVEDARFVRFVNEAGEVDYRATYTAYDGVRIEPRLFTSPDLRTFTSTRLAGAAARNKGMALFPRLVGGRYLALARSDGENTFLTRSSDGLVWEPPELIDAPRGPWQLLQVGNGGSPIETDQGWLVLTHGVGAMREYAIGALLLDLDDPRRVVARLEGPLLHATSAEQDGYVPNVVYSCGGLMHDGRLWLPYGIGDSRIGVAWVDTDELIQAMTTCAP
jgi:predicted GH43/DUF377 family glycosyl hydrolase